MQGASAWDILTIIDGEPNVVRTKAYDSITIEELICYECHEVAPRRLIQKINKEYLA